MDTTLGGETVARAKLIKYLIKNPIRNF